MTQHKLGCTPPDAPTDEQMKSAQQMLNGNEAAFLDRVGVCSDLAVASLPPLPPGVIWVSEAPAHDPTLLPERKARKPPHKVEGFGGSLDLMTSDRSLIVDLKFVSKQPNAIKVSYLWQLASYSMLTGVKKTMLLWVMTTGKSFYTACIDWSDPRYSMLPGRVRKFVERVGHKNFHDYVYPVEGEWCDYCDHKRKCPLKLVEPPKLGNDMFSRPDNNSWLDSLMASASQPTPPTLTETKPLF
jgi:hypothetical protein